jgi:hypothetical protein
VTRGLCLLTCTHRRNKEVSKLSLLAVSLQDTSSAIGVTEVRRSCSRLQQVIRAWSENENETEREVSLDGIIAAHEQLKTDFTTAQTWLTKYAETGNVPEDGTRSVR